MYTGSKTTYLLLERGVEDKQLLAELHKITAAIKIKSVKEFARTFPMIHKLKQSLISEKDLEV